MGEIIVVSINDCKHLNVGSINNKKLKVIKVIKFNLLVILFLLC